MSTEAVVESSENSEEVHEDKESDSLESVSDIEIHWLQRFYDNPWLLLILGILIPFLSYTLWGWVELAMIEPAELP